MALSRSDRLYIILYCITIDIETQSQLGMPLLRHNLNSLASGMPKTFFYFLQKNC